MAKWFNNPQKEYVYAHLGAAFIFVDKQVEADKLRTMGNDRGVSNKWWRSSRLSAGSTSKGHVAVNGRSFTTNFFPLSAHFCDFNSSLILIYQYFILES